MTYCVAIRVNDGLVFASDTRTSAGVDDVSTYRKMHIFSVPGERLIVLLAAGNLATTQAVINRVQRHMDEANSTLSLNNAKYLFEAADYVGKLSYSVQAEYEDALKSTGINGEASFILGGQIRGQKHEIYRVYPQGNYISAPPTTPYLQIGETKYGKPILDRMITPETAVNQAARCAVVSLDSTMRSNLSVGPPLELAVCRKDSLEISHYMELEPSSEFYEELHKRWNQGLKQAFGDLPPFDWE